MHPAMRTTMTEAINVAVRHGPHGPPLAIAPQRLPSLVGMGGDIARAMRYPAHAFFSQNEQVPIMKATQILGGLAVILG